MKYYLAFFNEKRIKEYYVHKYVLIMFFHYSKSGSLEKRSQINFLIKVSKYLDIIPGNNLSVLVQVYTARLCKEGFTNYKFSVFLLALKLLPSIWHTSLKIEKW